MHDKEIPKTSTYAMACPPECPCDKPCMDCQVNNEQKEIKTPDGSYLTEREDWSEEFDDRVSKEKFTEYSKTKLGCCGGDYCEGDHNENIKSFIKKLLARKEAEARTESYHNGWKEAWDEAYAKGKEEGYEERKKEEPEYYIEEHRKKIIQSERARIAEALMKMTKEIDNDWQLLANTSYNKALEEVLKILNQ